MEDDRAWTTRKRAADAVQSFNSCVASELRQHAQALTEAAERVDANPDLLDRRHIMAGGPYHPGKIMQLWLAAREAQSEIDELCGPRRVMSERHAKAMMALAALEALRSASRQDGIFSASTPLKGEIDQVMRDLIGKAAGTRRVGDQVCWREGEAKITGTIIAIADGICAVSRMTSWKGGSGTGVRGIATRAVTELELTMPDLY